LPITKNLLFLLSNDFTIIKRNKFLKIIKKKKKEEKMRKKNGNKRRREESHETKRKERVQNTRCP
jgi:hypothetical protein